MPDSLSSRIRTEARRLGFQLVGLAPLRPSDHAAFYRRWIDAGHHGTMAYLARDDAVAARLDPPRRWPELRSAVVVGHFYAADAAGPDPQSPGPPVPRLRTRPGEVDPPGAAPNPAHAIIARYARGRDYHRVVKKKLLALLRFVEAEVGQELPQARAYVDTGPVLERELGRRAGLGWFGRNTMLIHPRMGSYFFLGELLLPMELDYDEPFEADRCGSCRACLDACPTGALLGRDEDGAPAMNASLCISYLTIENRGAIPEELRPAMGTHVFGCDICQEVCPFNNPRFLPEAVDPDYLARPERPTSSSKTRSTGGAGPRGEDDLPGTEGPSGRRQRPATDAPSLVRLMNMTEGEWDVWTRGSAIRRAGWAGLRRNAAVALGNGLAQAGPGEVAAGRVVVVLEEALEDDEPLVRTHAAWALGRVGSSGAVDALRSALESEQDPVVRDELEAALNR